VNNQELLFSDMVFFEPTDEEDSYANYRRNITRQQDPNDNSWHGIYKLLWKALINTVKTRRIIQNQMLTNYPDAVDHLFNHAGLSKSKSFGREEIEAFMNDMSITLDYEHSHCLMQSLDRDQDNLASYEEIFDAIYGAE